MHHSARWAERGHSVSGCISQCDSRSLRRLISHIIRLERSGWAESQAMVRTSADRWIPEIQPRRDNDRILLPTESMLDCTPTCGRPCSAVLAELISIWANLTTYKDEAFACSAFTNELLIQAEAKNRVVAHVRVEFAKEVTTPTTSNMGLRHFCFNWDRRPKYPSPNILPC